MAQTTVGNTSSIAMALAGMTASVDIPKPRDTAFWTGKDSFAAVAARSSPGNPQHPSLPTPPSSISPTLPPQVFKSHVEAGPPTPPAHPLVDSDIDLQDAVDHANAQDQPQRGLGLGPTSGNLAGLDAAGAITPGLLAKHHLPEILLHHGPLAIRHVMGYLTISVPGFSGIPPAKARRLVVGALEGRGSGGEGGGIHGDVEFEKVGWGRWDARLRGQPSKNDRNIRRQSPTATRHPVPALRSPSPYATKTLRIPLRGARPSRVRLHSRGSHHRLREQAQPSPSLSMHAHDHETEADKMSLNGSDDDDASCSSSEAPDEGPVLDEDAGDVTDEEDWASMGAAALRQGSLPHNAATGHLHTISTKARHGSSKPTHKQERGGPSSNTLAKSAPMAVGLPPQVRPYFNNLIFSTDLMEGDDQEREAIHALLRLGSV